MELGWLRVRPLHCRRVKGRQRVKCRRAKWRQRVKCRRSRELCPARAEQPVRPWCPGQQLLERPGQSSWPEPSLFRAQLEQPATRRYQRVKVRRDWSPERRPDLERRW